MPNMTYLALRMPNQIALIKPIEEAPPTDGPSVRNRLGGGANSSHLAAVRIENVTMRFCDVIANIFTVQQDIVNWKTALQTSMSYTLTHIIT